MKTNLNVFSYQARLLAVLCIITQALLCSYVFFIRLLSGLQQRDTHSFQLCKLENGCFHASRENVICCHGVQNTSHCFRKLGNVAILFAIYQLLFLCIQVPYVLRVTEVLASWGLHTFRGENLSSLLAPSGTAFIFNTFINTC